MENKSVIRNLRLGVLTFILCLVGGLHLERELLSQASTVELLVVLTCVLIPTVPVLVAMRMAGQQLEANPAPTL